MLRLQRKKVNLLRDPRYPRNGWIGVDLDGTLSQTVSGPNPFRIGPPVPIMRQRVLHWVKSGRQVKIFTARAADKEQRKMIEHWCKCHGLPNLEITDRKDFRMVALWDDRAVGVITNLGIPVLPIRLAFWQRLRLCLSLIFRRDAAVALNRSQLRGHLRDSEDYGRMFIKDYEL